MLIHGSVLHGTPIIQLRRQARIAKTITVNGNMDIQGGALIWYGNGAIAQNLVVNGNVRVATLAAICIMVVRNQSDNVNWWQSY